MMLRVASIIALCVLLSDASTFYDEAKSTHLYGENAEARKIKLPKSEFLRRLFSDSQDDQSSCVEKLNPAEIARYIVNQAAWSSIATISTRPEIEGQSTVNLISIADGPSGNGTGVPYMYLTPLDYVAQDLLKNHAASLLMSLVQGDYCKQKGLDPMDPRCCRVMLAGKIKAVKDETQKNIVKKFFFDRHPTLVNMPPSHKFFFAQFDISNIALLYTFGGQKIIPVDEYFNSPANCENVSTKVVPPFVFKPIV